MPINRGGGGTGAAALRTEDAVVVQVGRRPGEPTVITVNCPDKTGLGCDICRTILEFGLCISRGGIIHFDFIPLLSLFLNSNSDSNSIQLLSDVSTDGQWCFLVYWVLPYSNSIKIHWTNLKSRLLSMCPTFAIPFYPDLTRPAISHIYLLNLFSPDRKGLLHGTIHPPFLLHLCLCLCLLIHLFSSLLFHVDVTQVLSELELVIHRVKVSTTPDGRVVDLFFITDAL